MATSNKKSISFIATNEFEEHIISVMNRLKSTEYGMKGIELGIDKSNLNKSSLIRAAILAGLKVIEKECLK